MSRFTRLRSGRQIPLHGYSQEHLSTRVRRAYREEVDRTHRSLLNAALAFAATFGLLRALTHAIRLDLLPWGNIVLGGALHIHHYAWGVGLLLVLGLLISVDIALGTIALAAAYFAANSFWRRLGRELWHSSRERRQAT